MRKKMGLSVKLLEHARFEVLPTATAEELVHASVPTEVTITVTSSPSKGLDPTLELTERLRARGYSVVPHVAARQVRDVSHLEEVIARLVAAGIDDVFVPAGDAEAPAGDFTSAYDLLRALEAMGQPIARRGITGYPERHRAISDDVTIQSMWEKQRYATYLVSNLCFSPRALRHWIQRIRARGVTLPLFLGLAGPVDQAKLMRMAAKIGVAESARFATGHGKGMLRLGTPGAYNPTKLLRNTGALSDPAWGVEGLHVFTFNQLAASEEWRQSLLAEFAPQTTR